MKLISIITLAIAVIMILSIVGCGAVYRKIKTDLSAQPSMKRKESKDSLPEKLLIHSVPHNPRRQRGADCGPDSLRMVLNYYDKDVKEGEIVRQLNNRGGHGGVSLGQLAKIASNYNLKAYLMSRLELDILKVFLVKGWPPIVPYNPRVRRGHAVVLIGYNDIEKRLFVNDPNYVKVRRFPYHRFLPLWNRHGSSCLLIVPESYTREDIAAAVRKYVDSEFQ